MVFHVMVMPGLGEIGTSFLDALMGERYRTEAAQDVNSSMRTIRG